MRGGLEGDADATGMDPAALPPVLLIPGWWDDAPAMVPLARRLVAHGWPPERVEAVGFRDSVGCCRAHADEIDAAAAALRERVGAGRVDVVAHSMGGLAVRHWLGRRPAVRRALFLATPHRGTWAAWLVWGEGGRQMRPGSPFLRGLPPLSAEVEAAAVYTPLDLRLFPPSTARPADLPAWRVWSPTHAGMLRHRGTARTVASLLLRPALGA